MTEQPTSKQRVVDHLDQVVDCLRYRPVATTALQMRQAADEIQRCWRERNEDVDRMERAAIVIERLRAALEKAAETFEDFEKGLELLNRPLLAEACQIAGEAACEALRGVAQPDETKPTQPERPWGWFREITPGMFTVEKGDWPPPEPDDTAWSPLYSTPEGRPAQAALRRKSGRQLTYC